MKRIILVSAIALLAACGSSDNSASVSTNGDQPAATSGVSDTTIEGSDTTIEGSDTTIEGSEDTITVENFGDMPPKCIELLSDFLKKIEPTVSEIDWDTATLGDFETFGDTFKTESDAFDADTSAAGCNKYNLNGSDEKQFEQMAELAAAEAPGTLGFIKFLGALSSAATDSAGDIPTDCASTIAAIEPFLANGGTMKDLTMAEVTRIGQLIPAIGTNCTEEEAAAFYAREDLNTFIGS
jgi:hypothetical protein